jgi:hypothetical protein
MLERSLRGEGRDVMFVVPLSMIHGSLDDFVLFVVSKHNESIYFLPGWMFRIFFFIWVLVEYEFLLDDRLEGLVFQSVV